MKSIRKQQKGFTLVEILIVVVILAILAAMILPRFLSQAENGYIADAQNFMGSLRSSWVTTTDAGLATPLALANTDLTVKTTMQTWGMNPLTAVPTAWTYVCTAAGACTATRVSTGPTNGGQIALDVTGAWNCAGGGGKFAAQSDVAKGCKPNA